MFHDTQLINTPGHQTAFAQSRAFAYIKIAGATKWIIVTDSVGVSRSFFFNESMLTTSKLVLTSAHGHLLTSKMVGYRTQTLHGGMPD